MGIFSFFSLAEKILKWWHAEGSMTPLGVPDSEKTAQVRHREEGTWVQTIAPGFLALDLGQVT